MLEALRTLTTILNAFNNILFLYKNSIPNTIETAKLCSIIDKIILNSF